MRNLDNLALFAGMCVCARMHCKIETETTQLHCKLWHLTWLLQKTETRHGKLKHDMENWPCHVCLFVQKVHKTLTHEMEATSNKA